MKQEFMLDEDNQKFLRYSSDEKCFTAAAKTNNVLFDSITSFIYYIVQSNPLIAYKSNSCSKKQ